MPSLAEEHGARESRIKIPDDFLARLREDIAFRRISSGFAWLEAHRAILETLDPAQKNAAAFLGYLAQWVDIGFGNPGLVKELLSRFSKPSRAALPLSDYVHLRMAEGVVAMSEEEYEKAIRHLEIVLSLEEEVRDKELVAISNFWIGRCHRREGRYDDALSYTAKGKELALELKYPKMAAVMQVLESWLIFQEGRPGEAARILKEAEAVLLDTDDYVTRGNVQSAYGRIARRQGKYDQALEHFANAIEEYKKRDPLHRNLARSLANMAFVKRLIALRLRKKIDREVARRWKAGRHEPGRAVSPKRPERARFERLLEEAFAHLAEAEAIYNRYNDHRGLGTIHINYGFLCLDNGDLDRAASQAAEAYRLGEDKKDYLLEARARILQSMVENGKFEEQIEERPDPTQHAQIGADFARDAVERAKHTQNRRLLAKAYLALGTTLSNTFFNDPDAARQCCDRAAALLKPEGQDYVWEELQALKGKLLRAGGIDSTLREWSQGEVGEKTFQQITEEFAGIVIPKVWKREGRKVSRVAARLSISPKKVRRILSRAGLLNGKNESKA